MVPGTAYISLKRIRISHLTLITVLIVINSDQHDDHMN